MKKLTRSILMLGALFFLSSEEAAFAQVDSTFNYTGDTVDFKVPCGVTSITIDVRGAQGGTYNTYTGGLGARMQGTLTVTPGNTLTIWVGQQGIPSQNAGGGGGGSGIVMGGVPLVVAGAGGGASSVDAYNGLPGLIGTGGGSSSGPGGLGGNGGDKGYFLGDCGWAGGGGGFYGDGYGGPSGGDGGALPGTLSGPAAGKAAVNGGAGGTGGSCGFSALGSGGWGCGGGARAEYGGGGGGGYSGGGGGQYRNAAQSPGGGGGSYSLASAQTNTQGYQSGNGQVIIQYTLPVLITTTNVIANVTCNGNNTGKASASPSGGATPYTYTWTPSGGTKDTAANLTAGVYTVTVSDSCGNTATASATITQPTALSIAKGTIASWISKCNGEAYVTVSGGTAPYTYLWTNGATNDTIKNLCDSNYCCTVTDMNGCVDSACMNVVTGIPIINNASSIKIFPNPNNGMFTISGLSKGMEVEVYNYMGEKISDMKATNAAMQFNIADKSTGAYLVRILSQDGKLVGQEKLIKQD